MSGAKGTRGKGGGRGPSTRSQRSSGVLRLPVSPPRVAARVTRVARVDSGSDSSMRSLLAGRVPSHSTRGSVNVDISSPRAGGGLPSVTEQGDGGCGGGLVGRAL